MITLSGRARANKADGVSNYDSQLFCEMMWQWRFNMSLSGTRLRLGKTQRNIALLLTVQPRFSWIQTLYRCFDEQRSEDEERWITLGLDHTGTLLVICHTYREETETSARVRLISARRATKNEVKQYER